MLPLAQAEPTGAREVIDSLARTPLSQVLIFVAILSVVRIALYPILRNTKPHQRTGFYVFGRFLNEALDAIIYAGVFVFMIIRPFAVQAFLIPTGSMVPTLLVNDFIVANKWVYRVSDPKVGDIVVFRPPKEGVMQSQIDTDGQVKVDYIKRCIGAPGDVVEIREGVMYRNGQKVEEPFRHYSRGGPVTFQILTPTEEASLTRASFKLVNYNGEVIPLNSTQYDTNNSNPEYGAADPGVPYSVAPKFVIDDPEEARKALMLPAVPVPKGYYLMMGDNRNNSFDGRGWGLVPREAIVGRSEFIWLPINRWQRTK